MPSLNLPNFGAHMQGTFEKHAHFGGIYPPLGNPCQKVDFQKLFPGTINLPGVFAIILGTIW
jgi:hypothetical protein